MAEGGILIQEHSYGHAKAVPGRDAEAHFDVRPWDKTGTGSVEGAHSHYNFLDENMNLIDAVSGNHFLKELYPDGLVENMFIGHLGFDCDNRFNLNLHSKQQPAKEVTKWGCWWNNYDVVVVCLLGQWVKDIKISNWERVNFAPVVWIADGNSTTMNSCGEGWEVSLTFGNITFQE